MKSLDLFKMQLAYAAEGILERRLITEQHQSKEHWAAIGFLLPLSVTPEEGDILFAWTRLLRPTKIVELGTGTGVSTACLSEGWPTAKVVTIDNWSEGECGSVAKTLWRRLGIIGRIALLEQDYESVERKQVWADLLFLDGGIKHGMEQLPEGMPDRVVVIEHDTTRASPKLMDHHVWVDSPSKLSLHGNDKPVLDVLGAIAEVFCGKQ